MLSYMSFVGSNIKLGMAGDRGELPAQQSEAAPEEDELAAAAGTCCPGTTSATSTGGSPSCAHCRHANLPGRSRQWLPRTATLRCPASTTPWQHGAWRHEPEHDDRLQHRWLACELPAHATQGLS
jgi:hypothetical protein